MSQTEAAIADAAIENHRRVQKRWGSVRAWCEYAGLGVTKTYELIGDGHLVAVKVGAKTLIDFNSGDAYLSSNRITPRSKVAA